jgi:hypothetical protein
MGITAFGNKREVFDVADWKLDDIWQAQLTEAVNALDKFEVVSLSLEDRAELAPLFAGEYEPSSKAMGSAIQAIAEANTLDAVVLFASVYQDVAGTNQYIGKYGIFYDKTALKKTAAYYVIGRLYLVDAAGKKLDTQFLEGTPHKGLGAFPHVLAPEELKETWFSDYSPEQREALRQALSNLLLPSWSQALEKLFETE